MQKIIHGDCLEVLRGMADNSVDAIVTDPPYGIQFMGNKWDYDVPGVDVWAECLRVLKPGGNLLAFAGTRTQHRMASRIESAGFEIRDMIAWAYGNGYPKSRNVSAAMAQYTDGTCPPKASANDALYQVTAFLRQARDKAGWSNRQIDQLFGTNGMAGHWTSQGTQPAIPSRAKWAQLKQVLGFGDEMDATFERLAGVDCQPAKTPASPGKDRFLNGLRNLKAPDSQDCSWGTALKPAIEPITLARKPVRGTATHNVNQYGTGALNIGACRIPALEAASYNKAGRWPANLIHDGQYTAEQLGDAARFFYCAKASKQDRGEGNTHPTVKPTELMRYLCRLITQTGGLVLDPFMGSGSTGKAALLEGFRFIGIEREAEFVEIARARIAKTNREAA